MIYLIVLKVRVLYVFFAREPDSTTKKQKVSVGVRTWPSLLPEYLHDKHCWDKCVYILHYLVSCVRFYMYSHVFWCLRTKIKIVWLKRKAPLTMQRSWIAKNNASGLPGYRARTFYWKDSVMDTEVVLRSHFGRHLADDKLSRCHLVEVNCLASAFSSERLGCQ